MLLAFALFVSLSAAPVVAVVPFENQTGDASFDVLQKGLADMMLTDLANVSEVTVVERARLDAVLSELSLQRTKAFDTSTAVRVGKLIGATHLVTGALQEVKETVRLSVHLVDAATSKVIVSKAVFGPRDDLFQLEQRLTSLLLEGLRLQGAARSAPERKLTTDTLLQYSRAVDLADRGDWNAANSQLGALVDESPEFLAALATRGELERRLKLAGSARSTQLEAARRELTERAGVVLESLKGPMVSLPEYQGARRLTYRCILASVQALSIKSKLVGNPIPAIPEGREAELTLAMSRYVETLRTLGEELSAWKGKFKWLPEPQDKARLETLGIGGPTPLLAANVPGAAARLMGDALLLGQLEVSHGQTVRVRPTLVELEPARLTQARAAYVEAFSAFGSASASFGPATLQVETLEAHGDGLALSGYPKEAQETYQRALEQFPKADAFERIEQKLKGLVSSPSEKQRRTLSKAMTACDAAKAATVLRSLVEREGAAQGPWPVRRLIYVALGGCTEVVAAALEVGLKTADAQADCAWFDTLVRTARRQHPALLEDGDETYVTCWVAPFSAASAGSPKPN